MYIMLKTEFIPNGISMSILGKRKIDSSFRKIVLDMLDFGKLSERKLLVKRKRNVPINAANSNREEGF